MKRIACFAALLVCSLAQSALALGTPDFSGAWSLDSVSDQNSNLSGSNLGKGKPAITIKQAKATISIDRKAGDKIESAVIKLDGTESVNKLPGGAEKRSKAKWVGATLVITAVMDVGKVKVPSTEVLSLSPDGKALTVDVTMSTAGREVKRKIKYNKL